MWIRTEVGEMINLDHSHHVHVVEVGAPRFHVEVVAMVGGERHILAYLPPGNEGRNLANDYINTLCNGLQRAGKVLSAPMYPRHT